MSCRISATTSLTSCSRSTFAILVSARPILEKASRSSIRLPILFARVENRSYESLTLLVEQRRCLFLQQLRIAGHVAKRRPQIVRDGIGKGFELLVGRFEFRSPFAEFLD